MISMKHKKAQSGATLVELTVVISLLAILLAGLVNVIYVSNRSYQANEKKLEDEYNARNALVFITREIHSDTYVMESVPPDYNKLILKKYDEDGEVEKNIEFSLNSNGVLQRVAPADYDMPFVADKLELSSFRAEPSRDKDGNPDGKRVILRVKCKNYPDVELETSVALLRAQQGQ